MSHREERASVLLAVFVTGQLAGRLLQRELPAGMGPDRFAVQSVIGALGPITPTDLAERLGMAPTTVSSWIARLRDQGAVVREPNPRDGRSALIVLTDAGAAELAAALPGFARAVDRLEAALASDSAGVRTAAARLEAALVTALESPASS